jgi:REP element-mobilizing transposase RayT
MARPLRLQIPGGFYHVMARGNAKAPVFLDDIDRQQFLGILHRVATRLDWRVLAFCLMANHYHLLLETPQATLARGMRDVNGGHAQGFNHRHGRVGHVFQGRYKAVLVERGAYLLEVIRYIVRNPVAAGLCAVPEDWHWSSHRATIGLSAAPPCLTVHAALRQFGSDVATARLQYAKFVAVDVAIENDGWIHPIVAGSESFAEGAAVRPTLSLEAPRAHRAIHSLRHYQRQGRGRDEAMRLAYASGVYSLAEIGRHFGVHYSTVSRVCRPSESKCSPD